MKRTVYLTVFLALLAGCGGFGAPVLPILTPVPPSPLPVILSPTPPFNPSATTVLLTATPSPVWTSTGTAALTDTPPAMSPSVTPAGTALLTVDILGCNTSLDVLHGMGEVTNAFPLLQNTGSVDLTNVCATLSASDEARKHPDKAACLPSLPAGYQVTLKLTVDTGAGQDTSIRVDVTSDQVDASIARPSCNALALPGDEPDDLGVLQPIP